MRRDCPHCHESMGGRFVKWQQLANTDRDRNCPLCGKDIEFRMYPEEIGARILTILVVIGASWWAKERGGYLAILVAVAVTLLAIYFAVHVRLKDRQRFKKAGEA